MKVLISILRRLNIIYILYLQLSSCLGRYPLASTDPRKNDTCKRCIDFFLLQILGLGLLGFLMNIKKYVLQPYQNIEFLGIIVGLREMSLSLSQEKVTAILEQCQTFLSRNQASVREFSQLIENLCYSATAVLPAPLYYRSLQN